MRITLFGAAGGEVTGSMYLVETRQARVLLDAGLFQGSGETEARNVVPQGLDPARLDAVVLTHAHLDHSGRAPLLVQQGYSGPFYSTEATFELADIILRDSAKLQAQDAERTNRKRERAGLPPVAPLYGAQQAQAVQAQGRSVRLGESVQVAPGVRVRFFEAGHILGSASVEMTLEESGQRKVVVFSGDLGPTTLPILQEYQTPPRADVVFLESTYGDRDHRSYPETVAEFERIVSEATAAGGKLLVPTFAIGRSQQILYHLADLFHSGRIRRFPVFLDSPMAIEATRVYARHAELYDKEMRALHDRGVDPLSPEHFRAMVTADESKSLNSFEGPCAILAGAGMCTGGRIVHHLKQNLWKPSSHVLIVGYQSHGSLGRRLVDGAERVAIHGEEIVVRARVHTLGGFSAHAGQTDLLEWLAPLAAARPRVLLTHGENSPRAALAQQIHKRFNLDCARPALGETIDL